MLPFASNIAALAALRRLNKSVDDLALTSQRLASGQRINRASDDAAGLAIASSLNKDARVYTQAIRNGNDAISALSIAEGATSQLSNVLVRLRELASQAASGTFSGTQRLSLDQEGRALTDEYNRLIGSTTFNGLNLLNGGLGRLNIQVGYGTSGVISSNVGSGLARNIGTGLADGYLYETDSAGQKIVTADLNSDGKLDLVLAVPGSGTSMMLGNGDGTFADPVQMSKFGGSVAVADLNGDGKLDLISGEDTTVSIRLGNGDGSFKVRQDFTAAQLAGSQIEAVDMTGDGILDLVTASEFNGYVQILIGNGNGSISQGAVTVVATGSKTPTIFKIGDLNGDGWNDVVTNSGDSIIQVYNGANGGQLSQGDSFVAGIGTIIDFDLGDINSDGILDLVVADGSLGIKIRTGLGNGQFNSVPSELTSASIGKIRLVDMDSDGHLDIVAAGNAIYVFGGNGNGTFKSNSTASLAGIRVDSALVLGDFNGDGVADTISGSTTDSNVSVNLNNTTTSTGIQRISLATKQDALLALSTIDAALARVQTELGNIGSSQSRIGVAINNLVSLRDTTAAAESRIMDVDVAEESARMIRLKILRETGAAVLAQANQGPSLALTLLRTIR